MFAWNAPGGLLSFNVGCQNLEFHFCCLLVLGGIQHRRRISYTFVPNPCPQMLAPPHPPHSSSLPVPSHSWHLWRPPRSVRAIRDSPKPRYTSGTGSRPHVSGGWSTRHHQHLTDRLEPWPPPQTRRSPHWSDRKRPSHLGGCPASSWHHHSFALHQRWPTTAQGRAICRNGLDWNPTQKGARIPRTHAQPMMSLRRPWHRNRRKMERRSREFCHHANASSSTRWQLPSSTDGRPSWPMPPCKPLPPASSTRTAPSLSMLKGMILSGANSWPRPQANPRSPAASQPLLQELWLGLGQLPGNAGATGIEMANLFRPMSGDCPVKQSKNPKLLRLKKEPEKKTIEANRVHNDDPTQLESNNPTKNQW